MGMSEIPSFYKGWNEPESAANTDYKPVYPFNNVTQTRSGHMFELDDTNTRERVRLQHRSNTFFEMHPNGDYVHKVFGDGYEIVVKNKNVLIKGICNITIEGDAYVYVKGDKVEQIDGNLEQHVKGNYTQVVEGLSNITSQGNMRIDAGSGLVGSLTLSAGDVVNLNADLNVDGEVVADKIYSTGRIDAFGGISAGPAGFVSILGGLSIGYPVAVTGQILCIGSINSATLINAGISVNAPTGKFGYMSAGLMTDVVNTSIYDSHIHIARFGPTTPPLTPMV
jgi:hypothetical protein